MSTQINSARNGIITKEMKEVAVSEGKPPEYIRDMIEGKRGQVYFVVIEMVNGTLLLKYELPNLQSSYHTF